MMLAATVFLGAWRISTYVTTLVFVTLYMVRRDRRVIFHWWAWIAGFETAYQLTGLAVGSLYIPGAAVLLALPGLISVPYLTWRKGVRPALWPMLLVAAIWVIWVALGFHANQVETPAAFSASTEVLNEGAKTAWALAYFLPLVSTVEIRAYFRQLYRRRTV